MRRFKNDIWAPVSVAFCAIPLASYIPLWASVAAVVFLIWHRLRARSVLTRPVRLAILMAACAALWREFATLASPESLAAVAFVYAAVFYGRPERYRDYFILAVMCALMLLLHLSMSASFAGFFHLMVGLYFVAGLFVAGASGASVGIPFVLKKSLTLYVQTLPLAVFLLVLFPRFDDKFSTWFGGERKRLGFSEDLAPGEIAKLANNSSVAFRVRFPGKPPKPSELYWRGAVLWDTDGLNWYNSFSLSEVSTEIPTETLLVQDIIVEPGANRALFALDVPAKAVPQKSGARIKSLYAGILKNRDIVRLPFSYRAYSEPRPSWPAIAGVNIGQAEAAAVLPESWRKQALQLPRRLDAQILELARSLGRESTGPRDLIAKTLAHFGKEYTYTLEPGQVADLKNFLFETKRGFCEHFAAAFATLMRLNGVPARVVTGYQGAEYNSWGSYWLVRQNEAHAWAEVWLDGEGWLRVDPTAFVAPARIEEGSLNAWRKPSGLFWGAWQEGVLAWDGFKFRAELAVFGGGVEFPALLDWAELTQGARYKRVMEFLVLAVFVIACCYGILRFLRRKNGFSPALEGRLLRHYGELCASLARRKIPRFPHEGPLDYASRIDATMMHPIDGLGAVFASYARLRYGAKAPDESDVRRFGSELRAVIKSLKRARVR